MSNTYHMHFTICRINGTKIQRVEGKRIRN